MMAIPALRRPSSPWQPVVGMLVVLLAAVLLLYRDTAGAIVTVWSRSDTFAHGFLVVPIVLWLCWRKRTELAATPPTPAPWLLLAVAGAGFLWLLGDLAAADALSQFALVLLTILLVAAVVGLPAARVLMFPLGFLFFAVPIGEFTMPWLMERTADFTVMALRATGIPVYREGLQFIIPSGSWSVVEACSGARYLIASLTVGALFAYLNYRSLRRRWIFVGVALIVPIVANWLRAYFIVLLGHVSGNRLAVGADHLIYGWVFFGVVIVILYTIGARWSELDVKVATLPPDAGVGASRLSWPTFAATAALLVWPYLALHTILANEDRTQPQIAGLTLARWAAAEPLETEWTPAFLKPSAQWQRSYVADGATVGLYVAYYRHQDADRKLVSSSNMLVRSKDKDWAAVETGSRNVALADRRLTLKTARLRSPPGAGVPGALAVWQVYWVNGAWTASDAAAKAYGALYRLLGRGDDGAVIVVHAAEDRPASADAVLEAFLRDALPAVEAQLRRARDGD